ncbi:MAG: hypothetical protein IAI50_15745, partial [Candidatus Eremiobacteraeota bacterium]|nr:hypothetical protein [Candidatus Eremiobacteraeota bacterium]
MRVPWKVANFAVGTVTLAMLTGCAGSAITARSTGDSVMSQSVVRTTSWSHRVPPNSHIVTLSGSSMHGNGKVSPFISDEAAAATGNTFAVSDAENNVVDIFNSSGKLIAQLSNFSEPQGLASDIDGNLYIADTSNSQIQIYAAGFKGKATILADPNQYPVGVDSFNRGQFVAVTNIISTSGGAGSVIIYKDGKAGKAISSTSFARIYFCAFDATGNLYIDGENAEGIAVVGEIAGATTGGAKIATLSAGNSIAFVGGVQVTTTGDIAIGDQEAAAIYTYTPPVGGKFGMPLDT